MNDARLMVTRLYRLSQIYPAYPVTSRESHSSHLRLFPGPSGWSLGSPQSLGDQKSGILGRPLVLPFTSHKVISAAWCWASGLKFTLLLLKGSGYRFLLTGTMGLWGGTPCHPIPISALARRTILSVVSVHLCCSELPSFHAVAEPLHSVLPRRPWKLGAGLLWGWRD